MNYFDEYNTETTFPTFVRQSDRSKAPETKQQRRIRPKSYAEPGGRNRLSFSASVNGNSGKERNGTLVRRENFLEDDMFTFENGFGETYKGVAITDLEERVSRLRRLWHREKRNSISNFAISCLEPNPKAFFVHDADDEVSVGTLFGYG